MAKPSRKKTASKTKTRTKKAASESSRASGKKKTSKKVAKKSPSRAKTAKKKAAPRAKTSKKAGAKKRTKTSTKASTTKKTPSAAKQSKPSGKKASAQKPGAKKKTAKKAAETKAAAPAQAEAAKAEAPAKEAAESADAKKNRQGITIVEKQQRRSKPKPKLEMPKTEPLLGAGGKKWKPLIPSGPKAAPKEVEAESAETIASKSKKLTKRELNKYRAILLEKRAELLRDITTMEDEALRQNSGSLAHTPSHMAEQGSDAYDQSLSLNLAEIDRKLLREIDDALTRIEDGTYGLCLVSGQRIRPERLEELPWAKYSIAAAREIERRQYQE